MANRKPYIAGFTIVELLIVIVVIGILAAITIVAFNGIQDRAKASAVTSSLSNASRQLALVNVEEGAYPATTDGIQKSDDIDYQYSYDTGANSYCLTATKDDISYKIEDGSSPIQGGCPGHGTGGVAAITNIVINPSVETSLTGYNFNQGSLGSRSQATSAAYTGAYGQRFAISTSGTIGNTGPYIQITGLSSEKSYTASAWVRSTASVPYRISAERRDAANTNIGTLSSTAVTLSPNSWTRLSLTIPPTVDMTGFTFCVYSSSGTVVAGDSIDYDGFMVVEGSTLHQYADGSSPNWVWNSTPHSSTSTGPAS